jgi:hypothetical protein
VEEGMSAVFEYRGRLYPEFIKHGNACQYFAPIALQFCKGDGLDVGAGRWPLAGAIPIELKDGGDAMALPPGEFDYIHSSHCLEHLAKPGGVLCLYLPHPDMEYWRPQHCRKHLHSWRPEDMAQIVRDLGFVDVIHSERDLAWGFSVVGFKPA